LFGTLSVFLPEELRLALMPTLEKLYKQEPDSLPFRQPVDPKLLGCLDYFEIVRHPMDLSTIKRKLDAGQYSNPWEVCTTVPPLHKSVIFLTGTTSLSVHP